MSDEVTKELFRSTDLVPLSFPVELLRDSSIEGIILDNDMSVLEGSGNAIPHLLMVSVEDHDLVNGF
jgi:hypothetical protein